MGKMDELCIQFKKTDLNKDINYLQNCIPSGQLELNNRNSVDNVVLNLLKNNKFKIMKRGDLEGNKDFKHIVSYFVVIDPITKKVLTYQRTNHSGEKRLVGNRSIGWGGHIGFNDFKNHVQFKVNKDEEKIDKVLTNNLNQMFFEKELYEEITGFNRRRSKIIQYNGEPEQKMEDTISFSLPQEMKKMFDFDYIMKKFELNEDNKQILSQLMGLSRDLFIISDSYLLLNDESNEVSQDHLGIVNFLFYNNSKNKVNLKSNEKNNEDLKWESIDEMNSELEKEHNYESWSSILIKWLNERLGD